MQHLIAQIRAAFAATRFPGEDQLTNSFGDEATDLITDFRDKRTWQALDTDFLNQAPLGWGSALSFFSAAALRFYLPAYLIADIEGKLDSADPAVRLCAFVSPQMAKRKISSHHGGGTLGAHARAEFAVFTTEEVNAIVAYLWWNLEADGYNPMVEQALEHYWLAREAELASSDNG